MQRAALLAAAVLAPAAGQAADPAAPALRERLPRARAEAPAVSLETAVEVWSAYASRGQINTDQPVVQPTVEAAARGLRLTFWGNFNLGRNALGTRDFSELNLVAAYDLPLKPLEASVGLVDFEFPNTTAPATRELFAAGTWPNAILTPYLEINWDVDEADGVYVYAGLEHALALWPDRLTLTPGVAAGWGSKSYNEYYFGPRINALNDGNLYARATWRLTEDWRVSLQALYMWLPDGDIEDGAREIYVDTSRLVYGVAVNGTF